MEGKVEASQALNFILAGRAVVTLVSVSTGSRYTYKVNKPNAQAPHFVRLLTGPNNKTDYKYMGRIQAGQYIHDTKNRAGREDTPAAKGFRMVLYKLQAKEYTWLDANVEIWHSGKCGRCGRVLTVPESIKSGLGPICQGSATPAYRTHHTIKNAKKIQAKARDCEVKGHIETTDGGILAEVLSPSGATYRVYVKDGNAYCGCEWGDYRPRLDQRTACSHSTAALDYVARITAGRSVAIWTNPENAAKQHRPTRDIGDGVQVTERLVSSSAAWASQAAAARKANTKASWQESQQQPAASLTQEEKAALTEEEVEEVAAEVVEEALNGELEPQQVEETIFARLQAREAVEVEVVETEVEIPSLVENAHLNSLLARAG